jgi:hypothetical protein
MEVLTGVFFLGALVGFITRWLTLPARFAPDHQAAFARDAANMRTLLERAEKREKTIEAAALEGLIVRRWLRNALEFPDQSPLKAVTSGAAVALALLGSDEFLRATSPLDCKAALLAGGAEPTDPLVQVAQQWEQARAELVELLSGELAAPIVRERLYGETIGGAVYWPAHALRRAAAEVLRGASAGAEAIARARLSPPADMETQH